LRLGVSRQSTRRDTICYAPVRFATKVGGRTSCHVVFQHAVQPEQVCAGGKLSDPVEYKGFVIRAAPYKNNGHYQMAGVITRDIGGERKEHRFIRADSYASYDDAVTFTINKARQIIDLQGERIFDS
jgi:hypothetical protein